MQNLRRFVVTLDADTRDALKGIAAVGVAMVGLRRATMRVGRMFANMVQETADYGDAAAVAADRTGLTSVAWQEYSHAAEIAGISSSNLITALRRMGDNAMDARKGAGMAKDELIALYGSLDNIPKGQDELFVSLLDHLAELQTAGPEAAQKAQQVLASIFGRSGALIAPLTRLGADAFAELRKEAEEFGLVLSPDITRATQKWNDEVIRVKRSWDGIRNTIGGQLLPQVTKLATMTQEWVREQRSVIESGLAPWLKAVEIGFAAALHFMDRFRRGFKQFLEPLKVAVKGLTALTALFTGSSGLAMALLLTSGALALIDRSLWGSVKAIAAFTTFSLPYMLVLLGIAAAVTLAYLAIEDFITFLRGGDSALGRFLEHFGLMDEFKELLGAVGGLFESLGPNIDDATLALRAFIAVLLQAMSPEVRAFLVALGNAFSVGSSNVLRKTTAHLRTISSAMGSDAGKGALAAGFSYAMTPKVPWGMPGGGGQGLRALAGVGPVGIGNPKPGSAVGGQLSNMTTVNFTNNAVPAEQLGPVIQSQIDALAFYNMNREGGP
jgi:hypothetical protein